MMRRGLIGKIAANADYVAIDAPKPLLAAIEPWLQACVSASRLALGERWRSAFLAAPIWRVWLGAEVCGAPTLAALAPSLDALGRYFPLVVFASGDAERAILPPELFDHAAWFSAAETLLLATLQPGAPLAAASAALAALPEPGAAPSLALRPPLVGLPSGALAPLDDFSAAQVFAWLRRADWGRAYGARSFWWTLGGANFRPVALTFRGLPDPALYAAMLTGAFPSREAPSTGDFSGGPDAAMG